VKARVPVRQMAASMAGGERDDRVWGDLAGAAYAQARQEAQGVWDDAHAEHTLRDIGWGVVHTAMDDAHDAWRETQEVQELRDVGWEAVRAAQGEGQALLAGARAIQQAREQARAGQSLEQAFQDLVRQLETLRTDDGSTGHLRLRLWDRDQGRGL